MDLLPRDKQDNPGALELVLQDTPIGNDQRKNDQLNNVLIQHIIRSFDPCMVCTVH